ncbi:MAG: ATP-grasp domain-containing protein [Acidobacteria bacterium]|nr:ATP-grasp domain-containing protein [Acidobacteriota bacterium]NIO61029.1 ATP-grasp domain-containing protein [Acidobacteriota bacterium]NIQ32023.1 ATP-grasp domain-containing protein [Acidobacteriota bacterium]NIT12665.1 ATP-grasp domain-containing protein [Acidobacteriota bacterium]
MASGRVPVVFVAPFLAPTTLRFVRAAAELRGVALGLVCQDPVERVPADLRRRLAGFHRVGDCFDTEELLRGILELCGRRPPKRILGALEQLQVTLAHVRERLGVDGLGVEAALNFRDKDRMKTVLRAAGVPCARHGSAASPSEALSTAAELGYPVVAKPPAGAAAANTLRVSTPDELEAYLQRMPPTRGNPLLLEEFVVGEEHSFDAVSIGGELVWHSLTHYRPGPLEVLENPWIQWTVLLPREVDHPRYDEVRRVGAQTLTALGMGTGLSHMEWFRRDDGSIAVSEVAARPPGAQFTTLISYAHDTDFYSAWAELMAFDRFEPPPRAYAAGIAYFRGQGRGRVAKIHGLDEAQRRYGSMAVEVRLPREGQAPASSYEGEGYVVLRDRDTGRVAEALKRVVEIVRVELQ